MGDASRAEATEPSLIKSKQRVVDHGEVFTPAWMVSEMLDRVWSEAERVDSRFLEPACGSGNFLLEILRRKLDAVVQKFGSNAFEMSHHSLLGLMCVYGIELLQDNVEECRENLLRVFIDALNVDDEPEWVNAARAVLSLNIVQGDALTYQDKDGSPLAFPEWAYLTRGKFTRRDFSFETLTLRFSVSDRDSLFGEFQEAHLFEPIREFKPFTISELSNWAPKLTITESSHG